MKYQEYIKTLNDNQYLHLKNYPILRIDEILTKEDLSRGKSNLDKVTISENEIWLGCECINRHISINESFDILLPLSSIDDYKMVKAKLIYVYIKLGQIESSTIFPKGYYAACLIRFENSIPRELMNVKKTGKDFDKEKHMIYPWCI